MKNSFLRVVLVLITALFFSNFANASTERTAQKKYAMYGVAFYNLENLFDTVHDAGKNDFEYLPTGRNKWGKMKYEAKLHNLARVLSELCTEKLPSGPAVIGLAEVENTHVLDDLLKQPALAKRGYRYVDHGSLDRRGIECAFFYNPRLFKLERSYLVPFYYGHTGEIEDPLLGFYTDEQGKVQAYDELKGDTTYITRGFLVMEGQLAGEKMAFIVNHWPSRAAGDAVRQRAGFQVRKLMDAIMEQTPGIKIMVMGDMNDDPGNNSMVKQLGCVSQVKDVKSARDMYNPWFNTLYKVGQGTLMYKGQWNLFDQIVLSGNMVGKNYSDLKYYQHAIFIRDYLFQQEGKFKGSPLRTHASGVWLNGYSDHLPTQVYLLKEKK